MAAAAYFGVAAFFVLACFFLYALVLPRLPIIRAQQRAARGCQPDSSDLAVGRQARCSASEISCSGMQAVQIENMNCVSWWASDRAAARGKCCPTCSLKHVAAELAQGAPPVWKATRMSTACVGSAG